MYCYNNPNTIDKNLIVKMYGNFPKPHCETFNPLCHHLRNPFPTLAPTHTSPGHGGRASSPRSSDRGLGCVRRMGLSGRVQQMQCIAIITLTLSTKTNRENVRELPKPSLRTLDPLCHHLRSPFPTLAPTHTSPGHGGRASSPRSSDQRRGCAEDGLVGPCAADAVYCYNSPNTIDKNV